MSGELAAPTVPLTLSSSKGASGSRTPVVFPLIWFDRLTTSGARVPAHLRIKYGTGYELVEGRERIGAL